MDNNYIEAVNPEVSYRLDECYLESSSSAHIGMSQNNHLVIKDDTILDLANDLNEVSRGFTEEESQAYKSFLNDFFS